MYILSLPRPNFRVSRRNGWESNPQPRVHRKTLRHYTHYSKKILLSNVIIRQFADKKRNKEKKKMYLFYLQYHGVTGWDTSSGALTTALSQHCEEA